MSRQRRHPHLSWTLQTAVVRRAARCLSCSVFDRVFSQAFGRVFWTSFWPTFWARFRPRLWSSFWSSFLPTFWLSFLSSFLPPFWPSFGRLYGPICLCLCLELDLWLGYVQVLRVWAGPRIMAGPKIKVWVWLSKNKIAGISEVESRTRKVR